MNLLSRIRTLRKKIDSYPRAKHGIAFLCIIVGVLAFFTPLTPGSWLVLVGLELFGLRSLLGKRLSGYSQRFFGDGKN